MGTLRNAAEAPSETDGDTSSGADAPSATDDDTSSAAEAPSATDGDTSSGEQVSHASEGSEQEEGITRDEEATVPEYERLRQENLRKNSLKLQELGVPLVAASLRESTTTKAAGGEGKTATKSTRSAGASCLENCPRYETLNPNSVH